MLKGIGVAARTTLKGRSLPGSRLKLTSASASFLRRPTQRPWSERGQRLPASSSIYKPHGGARIHNEPSALIDGIDAAEDVPPTSIESRLGAKKLPLVCPGCGARSQTVHPNTAGFYGARSSKATHQFAARREENAIFQQALRSGALGGETIQNPSDSAVSSEAPEIPICDRCHYLLYQSKGTGIIHPSMQSLRDIIEESPHKHNHIYHILDAADFPMSLIPNLQHALRLPQLRTRNRRSKTIRYLRGRVAEVSFIITRSDLLAPKKEQVDSLLPILREILRDALGRSGKNVRLGNVRCVSANRGWWTKTVKEDIWNRGGAAWMVGKVNVGKSALYQVVFPKGRNDVDTDVRRMRVEEKRSLVKDMAMLDGGEAQSESADHPMVSSYSPAELFEPQSMPDAANVDRDSFQESILEMDEQPHDTAFERDIFDEDKGSSLLPPAQPETAYPHMPIVSSLPGTTASPIRIPFGNGKGELIDLPGIHRSSFDNYVEAEYRKGLVMKSRIVPEQYTIKPGQSILLGGIIRITPKSDELIFLAYPFVPLKAHVTSTEKAIAIQTGVREDGEPYTGTVETVATDEAKQHIKSAGAFQLQWDVTKRRAGSLTDSAAGKRKAAELPFKVYSADLLIESVGWVELTCQVRNRQQSFITESVVDALGHGTIGVPSVPEVEVWSPEGKCIDVRRPMNAWLLGGPKRLAKHVSRARPRQTISMARRKAGGATGRKAEAMNVE